MPDLTAEQLRAARAMLRLEQRDVAERAGVSVETVKRLEGMTGPLRTTRVATVEAIRLALERAGVEFRDDGWIRLPESAGLPKPGAGE